METIQLDMIIAEMLKKNPHAYSGKDNSGKVRTEHLKKLVQMTDEQLMQECKDKIWLSAFASNNPRSDYHWHCDACYDECQRRGKGDIYNAAHKYASGK